MARGGEAMGIARLVLQHSRNRAWHVVGVRRARLGWILGVGPRRERVAAAVAREYRVPPFDHGAGEARHAPQMERHARRVRVSALDIRHVHHTQRRDLERSLICAVAGRQMVRRVSHSGDRRHRVSGLDALAGSQIDRRAREHGQSRSGVPLQQSRAGRNRVLGAVGNALPDHQRSGARQQDHRRPAVLQHGQHSARTSIVAADRDRTVDRVAARVGRQPQAAIPDSGDDCGDDRDSVFCARRA